MAIPEWKIRVIKIVYEFCYDNDIYFTQTQIGKEVGLSCATISNIQKKYRLKRRSYVQKPNQLDKYDNTKYNIKDMGYKTPCWIWLFSCTGKGYAYGFYIDAIGKSRTKNAHIIYYELKYGPIKVGLELDHLCTIKNCVNPDHLEPVTHKENMRRYRLRTLTKLSSTKNNG